MTGALRASVAAVRVPERRLPGRDRHSGFLRKSGTLPLLQQCPLFHGLDEQQLEDLAAGSHVMQLRGRAHLSGDGGDSPGLCIVRRGALKVCSDQQGGRELILSLLGPGDFIGELAALSGAAEVIPRVVALRVSELVVIPAELFQQLVLHDSGVRMACLQSAAQRLRRAQRALRRLAHEGVHARIEDTLRQLAEEQGEPHAGPNAGPNGQGMRLACRPSQALLAGLAGTTRETVSRVLRDLEQAGVLRCEGRQVIFVCTTPSGGPNSGHWCRR